jgi:nicotinate-nucleotide pyrophosphorylase (carboxylating)
MFLPPDHIIEKTVRLALEEDLGTGDITSALTVPGHLKGTARFITKETGVICGWPVVEKIFHILNPGIKLAVHYPDGAAVKNGDTVGEISGPLQPIFSGERVALNFLQRLSGIATCTRSFREMLADFPRVRLVDTRKTTPGLRVLEKYAVRVGGGQNHRFTLSDFVLIKDNHLAVAGGVHQAVAAVRKNSPHTLKVEVEVETEEQVREALAAGVDIIMLDNMAPEKMAAMVKLINGRALVEASGNVTAANIKAIAATGVDIISIGGLTHSVKALDISLEVDQIWDPEIP